MPTLNTPRIARPARAVVLMSRFRALLAVTLSVAATAVHAVAVGTWKTDDSACEFGNGTPYLVEQQLLGNAKNRPLPEYVDAMLKWIGSNCKNGQVLMMGDNIGNDDSWKLFRDVAVDACRVADIQWGGTTTSYGGGKTAQGVTLRCSISKMDTLKTKYGGGGEGKKP